MVACANCGAENPAGQKFCGECGTALAAVCASCGAPNPPGQKFCGQCGTPLGELPSAPIAVSVERRLVSVMFADLVGFTPLSEDRDAEEVRDLLSRYFELSAEVIGRYGGVVEKFIGDAVMAVWGTPVAQEDDAERAVRAALDLVVSVGDFGRESGLPELAARAAVLTGEAAVNLGAAGQGMVAGDLVNTASRVQSAAEVGTVLVGESTRRASQAAIAYAEAGEHELKGKAEAITLWRALRVTAGRAGGLKSEGLEAPFVGRDRELRLAKELFHASADERKAHLLSIVGIAGIGKSRLAWELYKYLDGIAQQVAWLRGRCLAYGDGVAYWALAEMVRMQTGIAEGEDPLEARAKLRAALEDLVTEQDEREWLHPRLEQLLSLEQAHELQQGELFGGWRLFFERLAERDPVVLVFEDMQWADAALLDFVEHLLDRSRNHPILVVALARPELADRHPNWASGLRNTTMLALEPLSDSAMEALLDGFVPGLPPELRAQVLQRAEGVPLYGVETVRMLLDRGLLEQSGDGYRPTGTIDALDVPETLHALIAARLDGLTGDERRLLQQASVLGKTFTRAGIAAVSGATPADLDRLLPRLVRKEILSLQADPRSPERGQYVFLQDLLRQVAYESLPRRERKGLHLAAAEHLEHTVVETEDAAEIVASHYVSALALDPDADDATAIKAKGESTLVRAADRAAGLGANEHALHYLEQALELTESPLRRAELHERGGQIAARNVPPAGARSHFEHAITAFDELGLTHPAARVRARLGLLVWQTEHDIERAIQELESAFEVLADDEPDADLAWLAVSLGRPLFFTGRQEDALARTEFALAIAESLQLPEVLSHGLSTKGLVLSARGRHEEAALLTRHALEVALEHDLSDAALRAFANLTSLISYRDRHREALDLALRGRELARKVGNRDSEENMGMHVRSQLLILGEWDEVLSEVAAWEPVGGESGIWAHVPSTFIHAQRGELEAARDRLEAIRGIIDENEAQHVEGFRSLEALVLIAEGAPRQALVAAERAIAVRDDLAGGLSGVAASLVTGLEAALELGDEAKADELRALIEGLAPGDLTPFLRATGARFGARRAALHGDAATAEAGFLAAERILREIEMPFDLAVVLLEHAGWLAGAARVAEAESLAAEARAIFERLRATPWIERVDALPVATAVPTR